ncbi:MAG TPA: hypothetical protein VNU68_09755 [Verrucomicrobiae bacterium]|nr:hypothetical protein [Verrucomicrobiae bacterium]
MNESKSVRKFVSHKATRVNVRPLIALYAESGCGKTFSSLLLARGFVGPDGEIALADTESGRGDLYADVIPGGYTTYPMEPPFDPESHIQLIDEIENSGAKIGILDSGSHEWEGRGGVCDMANQIEESTGKTGLHVWRHPKMQHALFMQRLLRAKIPWIICLRAKYKTKQTKDERGKTAIVKDDYTSPIQAEDFIFEMTVHGEIGPDHAFHLTKCSHPALRECLPNNARITVEHGQKIAAWCAGGAAVQSSGQDRKKLMTELWELTMPKHKKSKKALNQWLLEQGIISDTEAVETLAEARFADVIRLSREKIAA